MYAFMCVYVHACVCLFDIVAFSGESGKCNIHANFCLETGCMQLECPILRERENDRVKAAVWPGQAGGASLWPFASLAVLLGFEPLCW